MSSVSNTDARHWAHRVFVRIKVAVLHLLGPKRAPWPHLFGREFGYAAVVFGLLVVLSMLLLDVRAIEAARTLPKFVRDVFQEITQYGTSGTWLYPLGIVIIALALAPPSLPQSTQAMIAAIMVRAGFIFTAIALPSLFVTIVKRVIGRARPFVGGSANAFLYHPLEWNPPAYASMPSGHATTAFAAAIAVGALWPRSRLIMWIYALLICVSRVVVTAHHPSDVLAGALVGTLGALLVRNYFASRRLGFRVNADRAVIPFEGPSRKRVKSVARALLAE